MTDNQQAAVIGAVSTLIGTIVGAVLSYVAVRRQSEADRIRRRQSIATALRLDYEFHRVHAAMVASDPKIPRPHFAHKTHDLFMSDVALFEPETVHDVLLARRTLDVLESFCNKIKSPQDLLDNAQTARTARSTAVMVLPLIDKVLLRLSKEGAIFGRVPESMGKLVESAKAFAQHDAPDEVIPIGGTAARKPQAT
jgi:hypothetical protein